MWHHFNIEILGDSGYYPMIQFQFFNFNFIFSSKKNIYRKFHNNKNTASKQNYMHNIIYTIGEKRKSQKVGDLYDDLALVLQLKHSK